MSVILNTIQGCDICLDPDGSITFTTKADIDGDGSGGNSYHDPDFQNATSLKRNGASLDAEKEAYIVVPPYIIEAVEGIVLGCQAKVTNLRTGKSTPAVVGDIGPRLKIGEMSIACAEAIGLNGSPIDGGTDDRIIAYQLWPGVAAVVNGVQYALQPTA